MSFSSFKPFEVDLKKLWAESLIVLDTSAALDIFRLSIQRREEILTCLAGLQKRLWLPDQVRVEFHRNYEKAQKEQIGANLPQLLDKAIGSLTDRQDHPWIKTSVLIKKLEEAKAEIVKIIQADGDAYGGKLKAQEKYQQDCDQAQEKLFDLFENRIGSPYQTTEYLKVIQEIEVRFRFKIPPGYKDEDKKIPTRAFGDALIWYQIMDQARISKSSVILIIADSKPDWWDDNGRPREELITEFRANTGQEFHMYKWKDFYKEAVDRKLATADQGIITEFERIEKDQWLAEFGLKQTMIAAKLNHYETEIRKMLNEFCKRRAPELVDQAITNQLDGLVKSERMGEEHAGKIFNAVSAMEIAQIPPYPRRDTENALKAGEEVYNLLKMFSLF